MKNQHFLIKTTKTKKKGGGGGFLQDSVGNMKWNRSKNNTSWKHHPSFLLLVMITTSPTNVFH